jgi:small subunit ribosomal protein S1
MHDDQPDDPPPPGAARPGLDADESSPEDAAEEEIFARLLEESLAPKSYREGETVSGTIVALGADVAFVDVGGKGEATIALEELVDPDGDARVKVGDTVQAIVVSTAGGLKISHKLARGAATRQRLGDAYRAGLPVEGRVEKTIKGGYEVRIGGQRAFCPISQIDTGFTTDPEIHVGQTYTFRIVEFKEEGKDLVVSRREFLAEEQRDRADEIRRAIVPDAVLSGRVVSVRPYGAFVDLGGGIQGLLHVSEMGWSRVSDPNDIVHPGDEIKVKVLRVDDEKGKISLGLKQLEDDPWSNLEDTYRPGQVLQGRITRIAEFGAFVELEPGIEALAHASTFPPTGKRDGWKETAIPGSTVAVEILSLEPGRKRIGVAVLEEGSARAGGPGAAPGDGGAAQQEPRAQIVPGARLTGRVERVEKYGVFVFLAPGRTGLIHAGETGIDRGGDLRKAFPPGSDIEVIVLDVDPDGRRIGLSRKAVLQAGEKSEISDYAAKQSRPPGTEGFGSLADKLRAAMKPKDD